MKLFHRHEWFVLGADLYTSSSIFNKDPDIGRPVTIVKERCECGGVRSRQVDGHWTAAELNGTTK